MLTLAVTTSTAVVGVAVGQLAAPDGEATVLQFEQVITDRRHAEELTVLIAEVIERSEARLRDVQRLVVDVGPGRFTGLRVGLASVKALALATGAPVLGFTSLEILAASAYPAATQVTAAVDARRGEVFQQRFINGEPEGVAVYGPPEDLAEVAAGGVVVGDGADRYAEHYSGLDAVDLRPGHQPSAAIMMQLAAAVPADSSRWLPGSAVRPVYLREPDVSINIKTRPTVPPA